MTQIKEKGCMTCLYLTTHEKCEGCLGNGSDYLYLNFQEGDGIARAKEWERDGRLSIVIGGQGEAEVNVKDSPEETLKNLEYVAEQCGYVILKGIWANNRKEIICDMPHGLFRLTYFFNELDHIERCGVIWRR